MKILHVVALIHPSSGGPSNSVTRLASEQAKMGHDVALACLNYPHLGAQMEAPGARLISPEGNCLAIRGRGWSPAFRQTVMEEAETADVVHNHGLWMWPNTYAREAAVAAGKPLIISPRGMLESWSLNRSKLRKAVAWRLFEKKNLQAAAMFHATAEPEAQSIRYAAEGLRRAGVPIVVAPNGVDLPDLARKPHREVLDLKFPKVKDRRWVVFLSRLHPKKGIDVLLHAWKDQAATATESPRERKTKGPPPPLLIIAGPDLIGYRKAVERRINDLGLGHSVELTGEVLGEAKDCLLSNASIFILPSYSENFGIAVAEAMSWARPVIASTGTPWKDVADSGAGWWIKPEKEALAQTLQEALSKRQEELDAMGANGRALVERSYTWGAPAAKLVQAYEKLLAADRH